MKRTFLYGLMACLLVLTACGGASEPATPAPEGGEAPAATEPPTGAFVPNVDANCRIGPSTLHPILAVLTPGAEYIVFGINEDAEWLFIGTSLTQCWVKRSTGEAAGPIEQLPLIAYGPPPAPEPEVAQPAGGEGGGMADSGTGSSSGDSGGSGITLDPGLFLIDPVFFYPIVLCGSYYDAASCTSHSCTWVPPEFYMCGFPPHPCLSPGYCK